MDESLLVVTFLSSETSDRRALQAGAMTVVEVTAFLENAEAADAAAAAADALSEEELSEAPAFAGLAVASFDGAHAHHDEKLKFNEAVQYAVVLLVVMLLLCGGAWCYARNKPGRCCCCCSFATVKAWMVHVGLYGLILILASALLFQETTKAVDSVKGIVSTLLDLSRR